MTFALIGRNLATLTDYGGFDPEYAINLNTLTNSDRSGYPATRTLSAELQIGF